MSKTSIQTSPPVTAPSPNGITTGKSATLLPRKQPAGPLMQVLTVLASLRLTVWLFVLAMLLVFFGTMAQMDESILTVLHSYFRTGLAWIPLQTLVRFGQVFFGVPYTVQVPGAFPFPGGYIIGGLLLVNVLAAHVVRFKISWKRSGILILHAGLILLMLGELFTGLFAVESRMSILNNGTVNYVEDYHSVELAFVTPVDSDTDDVVVVPGSILRKGGLIQNEQLPVDVEVKRYLVNSALSDEPKKDLADAGFGLRTGAVEKPPVHGTDAQSVDTPSVSVTLKDRKTGKSLGTYLLSVHLKPQPLELGGKAVRASLRFKRTYKPYTMHLMEFRHDVYPGTTIPRNYSSRVRLTDPSEHTDREVVISMNHPLTYRGDTFYQSSFEQDDAGRSLGTVLQVVRNPTSWVPYWACGMVVVGMMIHFGLHLYGLYRRSVAS